MRNGRDGCTQLIVRVTKFLEGFIGGLKGSNVLDNTAIASSLLILRRNLMVICADAKRWSSLNLWRSYIQRDQIIIAILRHEVNLTDCFHTFQIVVLVSIIASNPVDRVGTIASPGPWVSVPKSKRERKREAAAAAAAIADVHSSWATWRPNPLLAPSPPPTEQLTLIQEVQTGSPGLFGPRSLHDSWDGS
ncbi:hypothetical protein BS47DRAFT_1117021 [Hydnum rufescens UP504]|uniref:Uncharacterized protein n=1 Tax=Hydnum rufescens UP504 TaxID=1448309 RepID=A0A9P6AU82_9AGAM|nr:hypothetical protein BS47DRAFT_1117021 [Hydnum rufescens UP504]